MNIFTNGTFLGDKVVQVSILHKNVVTPKPKVSQENSGIIKLYAQSTDISIEPNRQQYIDTGIKLTTPPDSYLHVVSPIIDSIQQEYHVHSTIIQNADNGPRRISIEDNIDNSIAIKKINVS